MAQWIPAKVVRKIQWTPDLWSLQFEADIPDFRAGQFVTLAMDIDDERVARPYSLVNAPHERPLEVYFNIVPEGPLSSRLAELEAGDSLWVKDRATGVMTLEEVPESSSDLWLLSTGTALGPFLSMLKTDQPWQRFDNIVLVHGVRYAQELTYREQIAQLQQAHPEQLQVQSCVSREQVADSLNGRITDNIINSRLEQMTGMELTPQRAHVMLCGNAGMITDVQELLGQRGMQRHRRNNPGHITAEKYH